jgi:hypothetical protein
MKIIHSKKSIITLIIILLVSCESFAGNNTSDDMIQLRQWRAGVVVSQSNVIRFGVKNCFCSNKISDAIFKRIYKKSYKENCTIPKNDLRYIKVLHYTLNGQIKIGEIVCNKSIANDLVQIFKELFDAHYPIESMILIDNYNADDNNSMEHNNTSCFNFRTMTGSKKLSNHARGCAIDINPRYNPYVKIRVDGSMFVSPKNGKPFADRTKTFSYKIDRKDLCYRLFIQHGFTWGGAWKSHQDYQHFEKE